MSLPAYATSFVGRTAEIAAIGQAFARGDRLVSLLGPGGIGKTRLATHYAEAHASEYSGGTWLCDLTDVRSAEGICHVLARALDVPLLAANNDAELAAHLASVLACRGPVLLVMDNFERLVQHAPGTVARWLASAPQARFIVTSRERLRIRGETLIDVEPLALPAGERDALGSEAVQLFIARVRAVRQTFAPTAADAETIAAVVKRLDGLPLAIELAAARMRVLSLSQLSSHLTQRFELLTGGGTDASSRQATLEGAIEWSWTVLQPWEQWAMAQCSVFHRGFSFEAATAVLEFDAYPQAPSAMDLIEILRDKSLLRTYEPANAAGELRFALYESVREFASRKLQESEGIDAVHRRHATYFLRAGALWSDTCDGPTGLEARRHLLLEFENLRTVQRWAVTAPGSAANRATMCIGAALALESIVLARGPNDVYLEMFDAAVAQIEAAGDDSIDPPLVIRARLGRASARIRSGRLADAWSDLDHAKRFATGLPDQRWLGIVLRSLGSWSWVQGHLVKATECFQGALEISRACDDRVLEGRTLCDLARAHLLRGELPEAAALCERSLRIQRETGDRGFEANVLGHLGSVVLDQGRPAEARGYFERAASMCRELGDRRGEAVALGDLGATAQAEEKFEAAHAHFEEAIRISRESGWRQSEGLLRAYLGCCCEEWGRVEEARGHYARSLVVDREVGNELAEGLALAWSGRLEAGQGNLETAQRDLDAGAERLENVGDRVRWEVAYLCRGHLDLALARAAESAGNHEEAAVLRRQARDRAASSRMPAANPASGSRPSAGSYIDRSEDVRAALRVLERAIAQPGARSEPSTLRASQSTAAEGPADALIVASNGGWFRAPHGERVNVQTRGSLQLIMARLAILRQDEPGRASTVEELFQAGWPGGRAVGRSGASRVYVALSTLRGLGLREVLQRRHDGYLLDPVVPLVLCDESQ